jgi:hypothetical protein
MNEKRYVKKTFECPHCKKTSEFEFSVNQCNLCCGSCVYCKAFSSGIANEFGTVIISQCGYNLPKEIVLQ